MSLYDGHDRVLVAVDCIIFGFAKGELKLLLIKRNFDPEKGKWSLMGGFVQKNETLDQSAQRILTDLTGLRSIYMEQLHSFGSLDRDPVERTISVTYYALINIEDHNAEISDLHGASWFPAGDYPKLIFDHNEMVKMAWDRLKYKATHYPVGFELLPKKFTMPQLQTLYESIFESPLDKRNFIRKISSMGILIKLNEKEEEGDSIKKAFYYQFDHDKYEQQELNGNKFLIKP